MATKNVTLRLPEEMVEYLTRNNDSINQAVINEINAIKRIRTVAMGELKGLFTPQEWIFLADAFKGTLIDDVFCATKEHLSQHAKMQKSMKVKLRYTELTLRNLLQKLIHCTELISKQYIAG